MKKRIFLMPLTLLAILAIVTWGCEKDKDDVCQAFEPLPVCEIANACCPLDGGNCYYEYGDVIVYCNGNDCDDAENEIISIICPTASASERQEAILILREVTVRLMHEARAKSLCI